MENLTHGKTLVLIALDSENSEHFTLMKVNKKIEIVDVLEVRLSQKESALEVVKWIEQEGQYRLISVCGEQYMTFVKCMEQFALTIPKDFFRALKSRFWNVQSEIVYRLKCPVHFNLEQLTFLYGLTYNTHPVKHVSDAFQLTTLMAAYAYDTETTRNIKQKGVEVVLRERLLKETIEQLSAKAFSLGYSLNFQPVIQEGKQAVELKAQKESEHFLTVGSDLHEALVELAMHLILKKR
ncbi:hypothetical protein [Paenibacillus polymyxa]|uniref:Uncharacterized protein n=1 Tax=Paenibacillus polymyxa (strain SC2) TaxID=886882 RepID=E3EKZ9_PAEPS|nr:hypothetical protein [Paenibacillus polymyxa]ADO59561.1 hypothetical protein PPSC2_27300 [Paenibacillus polymyxa SC2]WPQ59609.1 hypothetical protein SKN87_28525 [Paenibacillus polymyxa]